MSITTEAREPSGSAPKTVETTPEVNLEPDADLELPEEFRLARIPVSQLGHFPDNVRENYHITQEFCASLKAQLQVPLTVIPIPADYQRGEGEEEHRWWVVKGNRRLEGAITIKLPKLLCLIDLTKAEDKASLLVNQVVENDDDFRLGLTPFEQSRALFMAHQLGATRTEIRKRTGRTREEVAQAIAAGKLSEPTRRTAQAMEYAWTLDELALLDEFDGDQEALDRIDTYISSWGAHRLSTPSSGCAGSARRRPRTTGCWPISPLPAFR
ncbi:ParB/RepB/Spo0J family partition protein [Nonomuraea ferruginea]